MTSDFFPEIPYIHWGCYRDEIPRAIELLEGKKELTLILNGQYRTRKNAIHRCYLAAFKLGYSVFALQDRGQCFSSKAAAKTYKKYGQSSNCGSEKTGGAFANQVYSMKEGNAKVSQFIN